MKKGAWSVDWILGGVAVLFFLIGKFFAPYYLNLAAEAVGEETKGVSGSVFLVSGLFALLLVIRLIFRFKKR